MASKPKGKKKVVPYWWFAAETVNALRDQLSAGPVERLEVRIDDKQSMTLTVVRPGVAVAAGEGALNKSFICPPFCP